MKQAYVETLKSGEILVEVQVKKKRIESFFYNFENLNEFRKFKKENLDVEFIEICPSCKQTFERLLALSRKDNKTMICDSCGTREALESLIIIYK
jgi:predicted RNA-binding Zn-ribbon protein involved in translation (DUF1610 family)